MLKIYDKESDIPEGLRAEYKQSGAKWVPDLADDHPVIVQNKTLIQEKSVEEAKVKKLRGDLDDALAAAKTSDVPRGQTLVSKADAELLEKYRPLGTPDELATVKTEHGTLKETETKRQRDDTNRLVAKELGYNTDAFVSLPNLPEFEIRDGKDGKKSVVAKVTEGDKVVEKPAKDYIEANHAPLLPALVAKAGVQVPANGSGTDSQPASQFGAAREFGKQYNEVKQGATSDLEARFGLAKSA